MDYTGQHNSKSYSSFCSRFLLSQVIELDNDKISGFVSENPSVPKILLFTDKKGVPNVFKALSVAFENKMHFGLVRPEHDEVCNKYKIKSFPKILVVRMTDPKPKEY